MISKSEYIRLYCNDTLAHLGEIRLDLDKISARLDVDPETTLRDLEDHATEREIAEVLMKDISRLAGEVDKAVKASMKNAEVPKHEFPNDPIPHFEWGDEDSIK